MSDGHNPDLAAWFAPFIGVATAALGALGLWLAQRLLGKAAFQQALTSGFQTLMERAEALHAEERAAWHGERLQLRGEIVNLKQVVATLTDTLRRNGMTGLPEAEHPDPIITLTRGDDE
jgi:hypothetical protein